jgi:hypothetical protein
MLPHRGPPDSVEFERVQPAVRTTTHSGRSPNRLISGSVVTDGLAGSAGAVRSDPKLLAAVRYLRDEGWAERGCILFSPYYDPCGGWQLKSPTPSARPPSVSTPTSATPTLSADDVPAGRTDIQDMVKRRQLKLLVATDAASEGLNLQRLQTLINIDLPWNPSRPRYRGSVEDDVHHALSHRLKDIRDVFGTLPDTLEDVWCWQPKARWRKQSAALMRCLASTLSRCGMSIGAED